MSLLTIRGSPGRPGQSSAACRRHRAQLDDRDRVVVTLYYFENLTLAEIGRVLA